MVTRKEAFSAGNKVSRTIFRVWWFWPAVAVVVTFFLIMFLSRGQSVWFDEGYSILLAKHDVAKLIALTGVDAHPPLYYLLLKGWAGIFGWGEYALRSLSAIFASLAVGVVFLVIRRLFTVRTALVALPFLVIAPFALRYGYEIRMYALASLIGALATLVLVYAYNTKSRRLWVTYGALVALGMFTLYMVVAVWLAHVVWLLIVSRKNHQPFFRQSWVWSYILAVALFAVYIPTFLFQFTHSALPGIGSPVTLTKLADISGMTISYTPEWQLGGVLSLGIALIVTLVIYLFVVSWSASQRQQRPALLLMASLVVVPLLFFALSSLSKPIFTDRYMAQVIIYSYALIGIVVALGWRYGRRIAATILMVLSISMLIGGVIQLQQTGNFILERLQHPRTAEIRHTIDCSDQTVIVADDPYTYIDSDYYFSGCDIRFYSKTDVNNMGGYAPLHGSSARIDASTSLTAPILYHLHWEGGASFTPDDRYALVQSTTFDKQVVDRYELVK